MNTEKKLVDTIIEGIQEKKGYGIVIADLSKIDGSICKYFVICQGNSPQQVEAIAGSVSDYVRDITERNLSIVLDSVQINGWHRLTPGCACSYLYSSNKSVLRP